MLAPSPADKLGYARCGSSFVMETGKDPKVILVHCVSHTLPFDAADSVCDIQTGAFKMGPRRGFFSF